MTEPQDKPEPAPVHRRPPAPSPYLFTIILFGFGVWFAYDGYLNPKYQDPEYQKENPATLPFNQIGAPILLGIAIWDGWRMRRRQLREAAEKTDEEG